MSTKVVDCVGNLLEADVQAYVNTVNTVGVMGKGLALEVKTKYPSVFAEYVKIWRSGELRIGKVQCVPIPTDDPFGDVKYVINFPTKQHWKLPSKMEYIERGLVDLADEVKRLGIKSIAIPRLGCGLGGLSWEDVKPMIIRAFAGLNNVEVFLYSK